MEDEDQIPPYEDEQSEEQEGNGSQGPDLGQIRDVKDTLGKLKGGPKPPIGGAGVGAGTTGGAAAAEAGTAVAGAGGGAAATTAAGGAVAGGAATTTAAAGGAAAGTFPVWGIALIVGLVLLILFIVIAVMIGGSEDEENQLSDSNVAIEKSGPESVTNGTNISYSIAVYYSGIADDVIVNDSIPENTEFVNAFPYPKTLDSSGTETTDPTLVKTVTWSLKEIQNTTSQSAFSPQNLSLTVRPLSPDIYVVNQASTEVLGGIGNPNITPGPSGIIPPNDDNCGGYYTSSINKNPLKKNFGDPSCTMLANSKPEDKERLHYLLTLLDPQYSDYWFTVIIPCESSYNPNSYANYYPELHDQYPNLDPDGVWGLLQMGSDLDGDGSGKNGPLDRGDVDWGKQIANGVEYSRWIQTQGGGQWAYWQCANDTHP